MTPRSVILAALIALVPTVAAAAEQICLPRAAMTDTLKQEGAEPIAIGVSSDGLLFELLIGADGRWAVVYTSLDKVSCLEATGAGFELRRIEEEPGAGS